MNEKTLNNQLKVFSIITLLILIIFTIINVCSYFMNLVTVVGVAIIMTYILLEPVNICENLLKKVPDLKIKPKELIFKNLKFTSPSFIIKIPERVISIFAVYILFIIFVLIMATQLIPPAISQISEFALSIPKYADDVEKNIENSINYMEENFPHIKLPYLQDFSQNINNNSLNNPNINNMERSKISRKEQLKKIETDLAEQIAKEVLSFAQVNAQGAVNNLLNFASGALTLLGYAFTVFILSFYFIMDGERLISSINKLVPKNYLSMAKTIESKIHNSLLGFLKGQVYLGILTGFVMLFVYIGFDINYAFFLCIFLAVAEIIPVIGSTLGFIPAIIVILFTDPMKLLPVWFIFWMFQTVKDNILAPKIVGDIIGLHPVVVILSIWIGFQVAGFFGIIFAIPIASIGSVIVSFIINAQDSSQDENHLLNDQ